MGGEINELKGGSGAMNVVKSAGISQFLKISALRIWVMIKSIGLRGLKPSCNENLNKNILTWS